MDITSLRERSGTGEFSVSELNNYIKNLFESNRTLSSVTVRGEISNLTIHRSGHIYFSLKDSECQIRAVMFRSRAQSLKFLLESGMKVIVHGSVTVYPRDGSYQIYVNSMQPDGIGAMYLAYEQLKEKLSAEGLFDECYKKLIPRFPKKIGVITSPTGAAVRDIINVSGRRYPFADIYLYPTLVQGEGAAESLYKALDYLDKSGLADVIIIGRGGGSIEDLWAFNDEKLARRIFDAKTPIISAVGHETDFTICDFVSDMRAPTPSAAAELAVPDARELMQRIDYYDSRLSSALSLRVERIKERLNVLSASLSSKDLYELISEHRTRVDDYKSKAQNGIETFLVKSRQSLLVCVEKTNAMSPLSVISRGYSVAENGGGLIRNISDAKVGEKITVRVSDGKIIAEVVDTQKGLIDFEEPVGENI